MIKNILTILVTLFVLAGCKKEGSINQETTDQKKKGIPFEEKITNSDYSWSFFERGNSDRECWTDFEVVNFKAFDSIKKSKPGDKNIWDFVACGLVFYTLPNRVHIFASGIDWFEEWPKAITKLECNKNICELSYVDYLSSYPKKDKPDYVADFVPKEGKIQIVILDSKHFQLVSYPKHMLERDHNLRGVVYRYFPQSHELPAEAFCQMNKYELLKNKEIYPPKEIECISPDDARKAEEEEKKNE